jgi:DNA-binding SARP family transcriptional activator/tetratricopeptide (TPR) repeat protein
MRYGILGQLELSEEGRPIEIAGAKQRALLAILLVNANRVVTSDTLIEALWEGDAPGGAAKALQVHVSQLRKLIGKERVQTTPTGYVLRVEADELDLARFERLQRDGRLDDALSLWRGPPLHEFAFQRFAQPEIARLEELHLGCLEERLERDLSRKCDAELVAELEALVTEHPLRERLRCQLMLALYRVGRQADALARYQDARHALVDGLGIEPGRELRDLQQAILRQDPALELAAEKPERKRMDDGLFVGRERELAELFTGLDDAFAGRGRLFLLAGEPGIGKTRLTEELIEGARERGARVLVGRCWESGGAPAYWPWVQSLRAYVRDTDPAVLRSELGIGAADLAQIVPEVRHQFPDLPEPPALDSEGARFRLFDATSEFLRNASRRSPLLLVLDDLHAADAPSLQLLRFLARQIGSTRMLILAALRNVDPVPSQKLLATIADIAREPATHRLKLEGLSQPEIHAYVRATASEIASPELIAHLHDETEGNPLFISEMVRLLAVDGVRPDAMATRIAVPETIRDVIARRLDHLSTDCSRVLTLAAILGREFRLDALARLADLVEDDLLDVLDEAMTAGIVSDVPGSGAGELRFAHLLFRDTLYDALTSARRVRLHRQAVTALESLYGDRGGPQLAELAHHSVAGADFEKGLDYARRAGDRALALLAYEEAARLYQVALDVVDRSRTTAPSIRCDLLLALAEAQSLAGEGRLAGGTFLEAADAARRLGLPERLARAALGYTGRGLWGTRAEVEPQLVPLLREALANYDEGDSILRATLLARLASSLRGSLNREEPSALADQAVEMAVRLDDPQTQLYALGSRLAATRGPENIDQCADDGLQLVKLAEALGDAESAFSGHENLVYVAWTRGQRVELEAELEALTRLAHELRQPAKTWAATAFRQMLALSGGDIEDAEKRINDAFRIGEEAQGWIAISSLRLQTFTVRRWQYELEGFESILESSVAQFRGYRIFECALALAYAETGRDNDAQAAFESLALDDFAGLARDEDWLVNMCLLSDVCVHLNDTGRAATLHRLLSPFDALNAFAQSELDLGAVARTLGRLAGAIDLPDQAELHYQAALTLNERMGAKPWLAHTEEDYARMLIDRDSPGDTERARELLDTALHTYRELGLQARAERCAALMAI